MAATKTANDPVPTPAEDGTLELSQAELALCFLAHAAPIAYAENYNQQATRIGAGLVCLSRPDGQGGSHRFLISLPETVTVQATKTD